MAKYAIGNQGVDVGSHPQSSPSTINPPPTVSRSAFTPDKCTHSHMDPIGEGLSQSKRQFRQPSYLEEKGGPPLKRATPRQYANGADADGAATFGRIGSGAVGGNQRSNRMGDDADHGSPLAAALLRGEDPWSR